MFPIFGNHSPSPPDKSKSHFFKPGIIDSSSSTPRTLRLTAFFCLVVLFQLLILIFVLRDSPSTVQNENEISHGGGAGAGARSGSGSGSGSGLASPPTQVKISRRSRGGSGRSAFPPTQKKKISNGGGSDSKCELGKVFMYNLPPVFNEELVQKCNNLDPWHSKCDAVANGGFGIPATDLATVVPENLLPAWYWTDIYSAELFYHRRMKSYNCRTENPQEATAFYVPFYVGLAVGRYLWYNCTSEDRDRDSEQMLNWLQQQPYWKKRDGSDHFIMLGRLTWDFRRLTPNNSDWGSRFLHMPVMKNVLRISIERSPWDPLEFSVPYPCSFHPRSKSDILQWQEYVTAHNRSSLFSFVGATRKKFKNDFRSLLMEYCKKESKSCWLVDCSVANCLGGAPAIVEAFLESDFCLQPKGDGSTRKSTFDCMLAGSIPVFFWKGSFEGQYEWHLPLNGENYSVYIDHKDVRNESSVIKNVLQSYSREEVKKMRETVISLIPRFVYALQSIEGTMDAFEIAIDGVLRQIVHKYKH